MLAGKYEDAERLLNEALSKNNNDPDTLANLVACLPHLGKSAELTKRYERCVADPLYMRAWGVLPLGNRRVWQYDTVCAAFDLPGPLNLCAPQSTHCVGATPWLGERLRRDRCQL